jgi:hypothetical protein
MPSIPAPTGPVQHAWYRNGYQQALVDLAAALDSGGEDAAREWITNNTVAR